MNILFVAPSYKPAFIYGGPTVSISEMAEALVSNGHRVTVYTTTANGKEELDVPVGKRVDVNGVSVYYFKRQTGDHTHMSIALWRKLWSTAKQFDIINLQSWWSLLVIGAAQICRLRKITYIVSPRGMLGSYSFTHQHSRGKRLLHALIGRRLLRAAHLHATTSLEWKDCKQVIPGWKGFIAPNIVTLPSPDFTPHRGQNRAFTIGFLSRIDPKKGLEVLFAALAKCAFPYHMKIAGSGDAAYIEKLKRLAANYGITDRIEWCGWMKGEEKYSFLETIDLYVLPSFNENFANAVIESLAVGTPVLVSEHVGLCDYVEERSVGWVCRLDAKSVAENLQKIYSDGETRSRIGDSAPGIIRRDFDRKVIAAQYAKEYFNISV